MRQLFAHTWSETIEASRSKYVYSDRVQPGKILHVHSCCALSPQGEVTDLVKVGIRNGGQKTVITSKPVTIVGEGISTPMDFFLGEGDQVFGYFPSADTTDTIELHVIGVLVPLKAWKAMEE